MTSKKPLISVVLTTYNGAAFLRQQLDSICSQTYPRFEIIAVDDGSTDETNDILNSYQEHFAIKVVRNQKNVGVNANYDKAVRLAKGELIALADQDDIWEADKLTTLADQIGNRSLVYADSDLIDSEGNPLNKLLRDHLDIRAFEGRSLLAFIMYNCAPGHSMLFRRSLLNYALPFPVHILYDQWLAFTAAMLDGIGYVDRVLVHYRQHNDSVVNALRFSKKKSLLERLNPARRAEKLKRRTEAAVNKAKSLREFCESPIIGQNEKDLLFRLACEYDNFAQYFFNIKLFSLLYKHRRQLFELKRGNKLRLCIREALGAKYLKYFLIT